MLLSIIETFLGLILLNISWKSLKKSIIRKWREGFVITLITGIVMLIYGILGLAINIPNNLDYIMAFMSMGTMTFSIFLISEMNGLSA